MKTVGGFVRREASNFVCWLLKKCKFWNFPGGKVNDMLYTAECLISLLKYCYLLECLCGNI